MSFYERQDFEPDRSVGYLARRIHQISTLAMEPVFAEVGLTGVQWTALAALHFERGATSADLARDLCYDKGAMTRMVDTLEKRGWVTRQRSSDDRRVVMLALTPEGRAIALRCRDRLIETWNQWLSDWDHDDIATLITMMQRLRRTLDPLAPERFG